MYKLVARKRPERPDYKSSRSSWLHIAAYLPVRDVASLACSCKKFAAFIDEDPMLWLAAFERLIDRSIPRENLMIPELIPWKSLFVRFLRVIGDERSSKIRKQITKYPMQRIGSGAPILEVTRRSLRIPCPVKACSTSFAQAGHEMEAHLWSHFNMRPLSCGYCGNTKKFARYSNALRHVATCYGEYTVTGPATLDFIRKHVEAKRKRHQSDADLLDNEDLKEGSDEEQTQETDSATRESSECQASPSKKQKRNKPVRVMVNAKWHAIPDAQIRSERVRSVLRHRLDPHAPE
jgi:hypothetical protein